MGLSHLCDRRGVSIGGWRMYRTVYPMTCIDSWLLYEPHEGTYRRKPNCCAWLHTLREETREVGKIWRSLIWELNVLCPCHFHFKCFVPRLFVSFPSWNTGPGPLNTWQVITLYYICAPPAPFGFKNKSCSGQILQTVLSCVFPCLMAIKCQGKQPLNTSPLIKLYSVYVYACEWGAGWMDGWMNGFNDNILYK